MIDDFNYHKEYLPLRLLFCSELRTEEKHIPIEPSVTAYTYL